MRRKLLDLKVAPRWLVQVVDAAFVAFSFAVSYVVVKDFDIFAISRDQLFVYTAFYLLNTVTVFYFIGVHKRSIRYSNIMDLARIFVAVLLSTVTFVLLTKPLVEIIYNFQGLQSMKVLFVNYFISSSLLVILRTAVKESFDFGRRVAATKHENILIFGDKEEALVIKSGLEHAGGENVNLVGFVVTKSARKNSYIAQQRVYHIDDLPELKLKRRVDKLIINPSILSPSEKHVIIDACFNAGIKVVTVTPPDQWVAGELDHRQLHDLKIEDILQREPIKIDNARIMQEVSGKRVLVTGAAGSIGSELVRQLLQYSPSVVICCDQAETALHDLLLDIEEENGRQPVKLFIGNVQNASRMQKLFEEHSPQIVFHAAAYKHVPMMEENPSEAVLANVLGTKNVAELSVLWKVEKFIMLSTDKAVNPSNIMGASKRIAEMYVQSLDEVRRNPAGSVRVIDETVESSATKFITTRFGNVLGSQGSVLPRFQAQIRNGGPVTVTHPEIRRFFMTIPEAVQLVLEGATMGEGGEIYVFDMGTPIKIHDLALQMIRLAGLVPDQDIKIEFTGLRPGEKLYEELLSNEETTTPTYNEKIKIAQVSSKPLFQVVADVEELVRLSQSGDAMQIAMKMKEIVPEFLSNNSAYEYLDHIKNMKLISEADVVAKDDVIKLPAPADISGHKKSTITA
jgi:FlaA1/EpsC-like NDP-sugar epimerase